MKGNFSKILRLSLALVLALSLSMVMAAPAGADPAAQDVTITPYGPPGLEGVTLEASVDATAKWTTDEQHTGSYSVFLSVPTPGDYADLYFPVNIPLGEIDLAATSFWAKSTTSTNIPYLMFELETGERINEDAEAYSGYETWAQHLATTSTQWQNDDGYTGELGPPGWATWDETVAYFGATTLVAGVIIENSDFVMSNYIDDVTIDGTLYEIEALSLDAGSTYNLNLEGFTPAVVYLDDVDADLLLPADTNTLSDDDLFAASNDSFFITLDGTGAGTFSNVKPLYASNGGFIGLDVDEDGVADVQVVVQASDYEGVSVTANVASFTYDETKAFVVTVTKDGSPLSGASVEIWIDDDADGTPDTSSSAIKTTGATGQAPFSSKPTAAGQIIPVVTKDIGGDLGDPEAADGADDIYNTALQVPVNPIALTVTTQPTELLKSFDTDVTVTAKLAGELFNQAATYKLSAAFDIDPAGGEQKEMTFSHSDGTGEFTVKPAATGTIAVTVSKNGGEGGNPEYYGTASVSVVAAGDLNVSVTPTTWAAGDGAPDLKVTIQGSDALGPDGIDTNNKLDWARVVVSVPLGQSLSTGTYYFDGTDPQNLGDATGGDATSVTFSNVLPNDASSDITVTVTGQTDLGGTVGPVTKTITVTGYAVSGIVPDADQTVGDVSDISMTVTTKAGAAVNNAKVTITGPSAGFAKNIDGIAGDETFNIIVIDGSANTITYGGGNPEDVVVNNGFYQVTGITFAKPGNVEVKIEGSVKALFPSAFTVLGAAVYTLSFEPTTLTAGVDGTGLKVTITENGTPVTDDTIAITFDGVTKTHTRAANVYTIAVALRYTEAKTLAVKATKGDGTKYGSATLAVELPSLTYEITEGEASRSLMLTGAAYDYTIAVAVLDALGEPLDSGKVWLGTYADEAFTALTDVTTLPLVLDGNGQGDIAIVQADANLLTAGTLVWKVGDSANVADAALVEEPAVTVEDLYYDVNPKGATIAVETTYTVADNYLDAAANRDVKVVTPGGDVVNKVTTPVGTFKYTAAEVGDYYVSVKFDDFTWQDPITVTVSEVPVTLESISAEPESVSLLVDETEQLVVTATYSDASEADVTAEATYESSDTSVATVSAGLITAVAEGSATVTVSYTEAEITRTDTVSVTVGFDPWSYDADGDGVISKPEAVDAVWDYFGGAINKDQALEVLWLYFG